MNNRKLRPEVQKHLPYFKGCVEKYGAEVVKKVLDKGRHEKVRLLFLKNRKDRFQMMQALGLVF